MSNSNTNLQTLSSASSCNNCYHGSWVAKNRPPMLAPGIRRTIECFHKKTYEIKLNAEAEAVQIILTGIDNRYLLPVDALSDMHLKCGKPIERKSTNLQTTPSILHQTPVELIMTIPPRILTRGTGMINQRAINDAGARENVEQVDWKDETDDESDEHELEAHYMYMATLQEEHGDSNITIDSFDICYDRVQDYQDETDALDQQCDLLASYFRN
ncbi:hypothetical protein Tco_0431418 [Tanacetum coccineum]